MIGVYGIENLKNNKIYIGQSIDIERRWRQHRNNYKRNTIGNKEEYDHPLYKDMRKYGIKNFRFFVIEECKKDMLLKTESFYITMLDSEYNQTIGENNTVTKSIINERDHMEIIDLLKNTKLSFSEIGEIYGVKNNTIRSINHGRMWKSDKIEYPIRIYEFDYTRVERKYTKCVDCNKTITITSFRCVSCEMKNRMKDSNIPDRETLKKNIRELGFINTGKIFGVTDNAVRKWCVKYDLPSKAKEVKKYNEREWSLL